MRTMTRSERTQAQVLAWLLIVCGVVTLGALLVDRAHNNAACTTDTECYLLYGF